MTWASAAAHAVLAALAVGMGVGGVGGWLRAALLAAGLLLLGAAVGYAAGLGRGRQAGEVLAAASEPLRLRERALRAGRCPVCGTEARSPGPAAARATRPDL